MRLFSKPWGSVVRRSRLLLFAGVSERSLSDRREDI